MVGLSDSSLKTKTPLAIFRCHWQFFRAHEDRSSLRTMPILDDDVVIMCPSDLIGCDNRGTKGVILVHLFHITVSD